MSTKKQVQQPHWTKPVAAPGAPVLKIYNSLTRAKEEFVPLVANRISWYCCGPTVYNHAHMGHARNYVCSDISRRILRDHFGYNVNFVQNVTDIDDKIIVAARQQHLFEEKIAGAYTAVTAELAGLAQGYLQAYVAKNLPGFSGEIAADLPAYIASLDLAALAVEQPKLPMYSRAAKVAHAAIYENASTPFAEYLAAIEEVAVPTLDAQHGSSVTDPEIFRKLPAYWETKFSQDMERLNVLAPSVTTRVSEYVPEIVAFVERIIANGFAYATADGSVYFDTAKFESDPQHDYAKLQPWNKGSMELINDGEGSLSAGPSTKKSSADFALWKASKAGEPAWDSAWGPGRPGWHIECSVMASDILGAQMDIHSGGVDLCFPHHDNELAQLEAYFNNKQWVNYFMHNGHLHIQGQKMSKSLKNFITVEEALQQYSARQLRLVFAFGSWDKPLDFKDALILEVKAYESTLAKFFTTVRALAADHKHAVAEGGYRSKKLGAEHKQLLQDLAAAQHEVHAAFCDSLLAPGALRAISDLVSKSNTFIQSTVTGKCELRLEPLVEITQWVVRVLEILGFEARADRLGWVDAADAASGAGAGSASAEDVAMPYVKALSQFRDLVRDLAISKAGLGEILAASDTLRADLINLGISLDDRPSGGALVKFLNAQEKADFIKQQEAKEQQAREKAAKKQQQAAANARKEEERLAKMKVAPQDLFQDKAAYAEWDAEGIPTKTAAGEEVTKSMRKKLVKQFQQQEKLHAEYLSKQ